jgi:hypothetical protein
LANYQIIPFDKKLVDQLNCHSFDDLQFKPILQVCYLQDSLVVHAKLTGELKKGKDRF